jgi:hypothetical protein
MIANPAEPAAYARRKSAGHPVEKKNRASEKAQTAPVSAASTVCSMRVHSDTATRELTNFRKGESCVRNRSRIGGRPGAGGCSSTVLDRPISRTRASEPI